MHHIEYINVPSSSPTVLKNWCTSAVSNCDWMHFLWSCKICSSAIALGGRDSSIGFRVFLFFISGTCGFPEFEMSESTFLPRVSNFSEAGILLSLSRFFDLCNFGAWLTEAEGLPVFNEPSRAFFPSNWLMRFPALDRSPSGFLPPAPTFLCPVKSAFPETAPPPVPALRIIIS